MNPKLSEDNSLGRTHPDDPGEPQHGNVRYSVNRMEADILTYAAAGKTVAEVGTGLGVSTAALAKSALKVFTFDPDPWVRKEIVPGLLQEFSNIVFYPTPYGTSVGKVDLAFVDGAHDKASVLRDIKNLRWNAVRYAIFHDMDNPDVEAALQREHLKYFRLTDRLVFVILE
jgi:predicted RNA methylase